MGHARALLALTDEAAQLRLARDVVARSLSVRETEALVKKGREPPPAAKTEPPNDVHTRAAEEQLRFALGTRVAHRPQGQRRTDRDRLRLEDELQRLYEQLTEWLN